MRVFKPRGAVALTAWLVGMFVFATIAHADDQQTLDRARAMIDRGLEYLQAQQRPDASWQNPQDPPAVTAIVLKAFVRDPRYDASTDFVRRGYDKLLAYQKNDGGIYVDMLANYNTAIAVSAIAAADEPAFADHLNRAVSFLQSTQWRDGATSPRGEPIVDADHPWYGGWGYNSQGRPDLSNVHFTIQALHDAGLSPDDPAFQRALTFISRTQNLSETNDQPWAGNDGGFIYSPADGGDSMAKGFVTPDGRRVWRSYGSMTYAGLKSMIHAGLTHDDPRVKAAVDWISSHWTLEENPGMSAAGPDMARHGFYYYCFVFAHALRAYGEPVIVDSRGVEHDWRAEFVEKLGELQRPDGSWTGETRWREDNPDLVTAYVVLGLQEVVRDIEERKTKTEE